MTSMQTKAPAKRLCRRPEYQVDDVWKAMLARVTGLEPATSGVTGRRSNQLSYTRIAGRSVYAGRPDPSRAFGWKSCDRWVYLADMELRVMILHAKKRSLPAKIVCNPEIMGGVPTIRGTRIPVAMILVHLRAGYSREDIFGDYPTLPLDGIEAIIAWAEANIGPNWRDVPVEA
jgi:uncharacterized protein (DUF433 family)